MDPPWGYFSVSEAPLRDRRPPFLPPQTSKLAPLLPISPAPQIGLPFAAPAERGDMASRVISQRASARLLQLGSSFRAEPLCGISSIARPTSSSSMWLLIQMSPLRHSYLGGTIFERFGYSSSASPQANQKETNKSEESSHKSSEPDAVSQSNEADGDSPALESQDAGFSSNSEQIESQSSKKRSRRVAKRTAFSDSDTEPELSAEELVKLVAEKDNLLMIKQKEIEKMHDKVLRTYAEMENVLERTRREIENSKKYGIQNFAKSLLDVADNLARASNVKESFSKIDQTSDSVGVTLLKSLLNGVEMTEKQLAEVFRKFSIEKYDPLNESFDPNRHNAVYEIPDESKPPGTVAAVLKPGYMLYDRVIRPAEVGVTKSTNKE